MIRPEIGERLTITQKFSNRIHSIMNRGASVGRNISPMDAFFDMLDGSLGTYEGANFRNFKGQVDAKWGKFIRRRLDNQGGAVDLANKYKLNTQNF